MSAVTAIGEAPYGPAFPPESKSKLPRGLHLCVTSGQDRLADVTDHLDLVRNASRGSPTIRPSMVSSVD